MSAAVRPPGGMEEVPMAPLSLERYAAIRALIDLGGRRDQVLETAQLPPDAWAGEQEAWLARMAAQARVQRYELAMRFNELLLCFVADLQAGRTVEVAEGVRLGTAVVDARLPTPTPPAARAASAPPRVVDEVEPPSVRSAVEVPYVPPALPFAAVPAPGPAPPGPVAPGPAPPGPAPPSPVAPAPVARAAVTAPPAPPAPPHAVSGETLEDPPPLSSTADDPPARGRSALPFAAKANDGVLPFAGGSRKPAPETPAATPFRASPKGERAHVLPFAQGAASGSPRPPSRSPAASPLPGSGPPGPGPPGPARPGPAKPGPAKPGPAKPGPAKPGPAKREEDPLASTITFDGAGEGASLPFAAMMPKPGGAKGSAKQDEGVLPFRRDRQQTDPLPKEARIKPMPPDATPDFAPLSVRAVVPVSDDPLAGTMMVDDARSSGPRLTLAQFASLTVEIAMKSEDKATVEARYGLDAASHDDEKRAWAMRFLDDRSVADDYAKKVKAYREWLQSQRG